MSAVCGHGRADVLSGAPFELDLDSAAKNPGLTRTDPRHRADCPGVDDLYRCYLPSGCAE